MPSECYVCGWTVRHPVWCEECGEPFHGPECLQSLDHTCNRDEIDQMAIHVCRELDKAAPEGRSGSNEQIATMNLDCPAQPPETEAQKTGGEEHGRSGTIQKSEGGASGSEDRHVRPARVGQNVYSVTHRRRAGKGDG